MITRFRCLQSGDYSDLTIKCNGKEFQVHKFVLCTQSAFFAKAVKKGAFEVGDIYEPTRLLIRLIQCRESNFLVISLV